MWFFNKKKKEELLKKEAERKAYNDKHYSKAVVEFNCTFNIDNRTAIQLQEVIENRLNEFYGDFFYEYTFEVKDNINVYVSAKSKVRRDFYSMF